MAGAGSAEGAYPGANGKIAFLSHRGCPAWAGCGQTKLFTIDPDGSSESQLLPDFAGDVAWSPDGHKLAYTTLPDRPSDGGFYIAVVNADGTGRTAVTHSPPTGHDAQPSWSPDGRKIAFTRFVREAGILGLFEIFTIDADGSNPTRLTFGDPYAGTFDSTEPAWSPDGKKIAFTRIVASPRVITDQEIHLMNADGTGVVRLTYNDTDYSLATDTGPTWSPDGSRIAFHSFRGGSSDIYTMKPDGSDRTRLTGEGPDLDPAWSPDGTKIAFANQRAEYGGYEISVIGADGSGESRITHSGGSNSLYPDWQPLNRSPDCSAVRTTPASLWPPDNKFVTVSLGGATDADGDNVTITATGVTSDEPASADLALGPAANQVRLRAKRDGSGDGRVYTVGFEASDGRGGTCTGTASVTVPHDQQRREATQG